MNRQEQLEVAGEQTLDPQDWGAMRALGHRMVEDMMDYLEGVRARPAWQPLPAGVRGHFQSPAPSEGVGAVAAYEEFREYVLPYPCGNIHPRFWGWVAGAGTPTGMLSEMLAAGMNTNAWGSEQAASEVEGQVLSWFRDLFRMPADASGVLTTGASAATLVGLCVARSARTGFDAAGEGWLGAGPAPVLYCSVETHNSVDKAATLLGLGAAAVRKIPVRADYSIDPVALRAEIASDLAAGRRPFCIVANVGTVNTGAIDDVEALADLAAEFGAWLHVDGAYGALASLVPGNDGLRAALGRADSIAFDLHKWLSVPYDCGAVLVRHAAAHRAALSTEAAGYLAHERRGAASGRHWFNELGLELSRGFRALKVWMLIKEHGFQRLGAQIAQNIQQAQLLRGLIEQSPDLELLAPVTLNVVCFRARPAGVPERELNELNRELLLRLQERGLAVPSGTTLSGRFALRVAILNHRSRADDFRLLVDATRAIAAELTPTRSDRPRRRRRPSSTIGGERRASPSPV